MPSNKFSLAITFVHSACSYISISYLKVQPDLIPLSLRRRIASPSFFHSFYYSSLNHAAFYFSPIAHI